VSSGPHNGVLTAIEDFLADGMRKGKEYSFAEIPAVFGLGVLFDIDATWSARLADFLEPYHQNRLIQSLETNRLRNYPRVIEMQDEAAATSAGFAGCRALGKIGKNRAVRRGNSPRSHRDRACPGLPCLA
jgi:hypothetical protein